MAKAKKTKKNWAETPHVVLVVDESGSMNASRNDTVSAINDYLQGLKTALPLTALVTVVKFDAGWGGFTPSLATAQVGQARSFTATQNNGGTRLEKLMDRVPLSDVRVLTLSDYTPRGGTPLHDAIGRTISELDAVLKTEPSPVFFGVITDGEENQSTEYDLKAVKAMIEQRTKDGWTFNFLGVAIDAYAAGSKMGFAAGDTVSLSRGTYGDGLRSMSAGIGRKSAMAMNIAASGETMAVYGSRNAAPENATWTVDEKTRVEKD